MDVGAVIVRWRGGDIVRHCLQSLLVENRQRPREIVVVDSGSGDGGAEEIAHSFPEVHVEVFPENVGFAAAANHGVAATDAASILLLNPDTAVVNDGVAVLENRLHGDARLAGVVPVLENPDGTSQHRWQLRTLPSVLDLALGRSGRPAFATRPMSADPVPQPAAAAWLVRRTVWEALGGLDEGFLPAWWEDVDFCQRLQSRVGDGSFPADSGFVVEPRARVVHSGGSSVGDLGRAGFQTAYARNLLRFAELHHARSISLIRFGLRISNGLRRMASTVRR